MSDGGVNYGEMACIAVLGLGEAGSKLTAQLCRPDGWREQGHNRRVFAVDIELNRGSRGARMRRHAEQFSLPVNDEYTSDLAGADVVISVVTGDEAAQAARMACPHIGSGVLYADFNSITGPQTRAVAEEFAGADVSFVDVAVMGSFMAGGMPPLLISGERAADFAAFARGFAAKCEVLNASVGDASAVKILRSVLMKGIEALSVECLVAARRQGLVDEVLRNVADVDSVGFARFVSLLTTTHLVHAKRRTEEAQKAAQNLADSEVPPVMTDTTIEALRRTVAAGLSSEEVADLDLEAALKLLDERVIGGGLSRPARQ